MFFRPSGCAVLSCFLCLVGCSCGVGFFVQSGFFNLLFTVHFGPLLLLFYWLDDVSVFLFFFASGAGIVGDKLSLCLKSSLISETLGFPVI